MDGNCVFTAKVDYIEVIDQLEKTIAGLIADNPPSLQYRISNYQAERLERIARMIRNARKPIEG